MNARKKRNGKQWIALLMAGFLFLAGLGAFLPGASSLIASLLIIIFLIWVGALAFLAINRAWEVGQDAIAFIGSILILLALAPLVATPVFGDGWLQQEDKKEKQVSESSVLGEAISEEVAVFRDLKETIVSFNLKETPLLLRFYLLVLVSAVIAVAASLLISRPSQKLPRAGVWAEKISVWGLAIIFILSLLLFSGVLSPGRVLDHLETIIVIEALLATLVAYYRWGVPPEPLVITAPAPSARPSAKHKEALRRKGQAARPQSAPVDLPNLDEVPLPPGPEEEAPKEKTSAPPGSPGSLEPLPKKKEEEKKAEPAPKKPVQKKTVVPQSPGWYPDPFASSGQRYWTGKRWGQQTRR